MNSNLNIFMDRMSNERFRKLIDWATKLAQSVIERIIDGDDSEMGDIVTEQLHSNYNGATWMIIEGIREYDIFSEAHMLEAIDYGFQAQSTDKYSVSFTYDSIPSGWGEDATRFSSDMRVTISRRDPVSFLDMIGEEDDE